MDVTRNEFQDLVGAYALDACEPDEAAAIDAYIAEQRRRGGRSRAAARRRGLARRGRRAEPAGRRCATACSPRPPSASTRSRRSTRCAARPSGSSALLDSLEPADLDVVTYNGLSVRDLVAHVAIVDEAFVGEHGRGRRRRSSFIGADAVAEMTEAAAAGDGRLVVRARSATAARAARAGAGRPRRAAARRRPGRRLLARVGARDPGVRDVDALPRHRVGARPRPKRRSSRRCCARWPSSRSRRCRSRWRPRATSTRAAPLES